MNRMDGTPKKFTRTVLKGNHEDRCVREAKEKVYLEINGARSC